MPDNAEVRLFELAKQQDFVQHNMSAELGVKTSLYLVFAAFMLSAAIQLLNFAKDQHVPIARTAVFFSSIGAVIALLSGTALLIAAFVRNYKIFPAQQVANWLKDIKDYQTQYPEEKLDDPANSLLQTLISTVDENTIVNEKKAQWIEWGATLLLISLPFMAIGGAFAVYAYFSHPF
jgi:hypothetical protein